VVDVEASDQRGRLYQFEIQLLVLPELPARILCGWADRYSAQLRRGEDYSELRPTYAIWLLGETLLAQVPGYAYRYRLRDVQGRGLIDHGGIWLFELSKLAVEQVQTEEERWLKFFNEGEQLIAVGRPVTRPPPHRSPRAELPHGVPQSNISA